ncbi:uncharacterized protein, partial [Mycetomoellerius zeteki]|uniref:uncharacterized protein n=1 Tax=Mycetomoellerius zeteki TaxID=64791 RepID=UPI00084E67C3
MYSAVGSNARKNYYVPLQNIDETPSFTKRCVNAPVHRAVRILGRKYALTRTGYKFLEIGINVGPPSYVEIACSSTTMPYITQTKRSVQNTNDTTNDMINETVVILYKLSNYNFDKNLREQ